ncbi:hypothetical protein ROJ8625_01558 [Roseivivax jejudonensis]|uniref:Uncharacterized protein n=1 Tax=Roseivivax jejudonensis TaxID=1529041 RepID=A0A1X6YW48_9RHOB|nr:hypothetical protein [Roseivivax jejudonensis]SLN33255.1 hypothetical protein ROJ8625_01558 [Roseivivax jejudonensis]
MSTDRRGFLRLTAGAPLVATGTAAAAAGGAATSRAALARHVAAEGAAPGAPYFDGRLFYAGQEGAAAIPDLPGLVPQGDVSASHFGVVADDRAAGAENVARMRAAAEWCRTAGEPLHLPAGSVFLDDRVDVTGLTVIGKGVRAVPHLPMARGGEAIAPAPSQLVLTGRAATPLRIHGISSMRACGAARAFSARAGLAEAVWAPVSLMNADAGEGAATPAALVVGLVIENGTGTRLRDFRVVADGGGAHGLDTYNDAGAARMAGAIDIGILQLGGRDTTLENVQCTGHFRRYGYLVAAVDRDGDFDDYSAPYETSVIRCSFQGMRAVGIRGPDKFAILGHTGDSVDLPWAEDHPFTLDPGHDAIRLAAVGTGTAGGAVFRYARVEKVPVDGTPRLRLSGIDGFDPGRWGAVVAARAGGANSHVVLRDCQIGGLVIPSGHAANDTDHVEGAVENGAVGGFEISGWRAAEADIQGRIQHPGTLMGLIHEARETVLDVMCEANPARGRGAGATWIVSPQHNENDHAAHPTGGPRWIEWRYAMVTERSASNTDFAPFLDFVPRPEAFADGPGWFQGYWVLRAPQVRYRHDRDGAQRYLAAPALSLGPGAEGYGGGPPGARAAVDGAAVVGAGGALRVLPVAPGALADAAHAINRAGKDAGTMVLETDGFRLLLAAGSSPDDPWRTPDGQVAIRPR